MTVVLALLLTLTGPGAWATAVAQAGDRYESDQFGYTVEWEEPWRANDPLILEDFEVIAILDGANVVTLTAITADWFGLGFEDATEVFDFFLEGRLDESPDAEVLDSDPDAAVPWAEVAYEREGDPVQARIEIFTLTDGDAYLYALIEAPEDDFADALDAAVTGITLDGDRFLAQSDDEEDDADQVDRDREEDDAGDEADNGPEDDAGDADADADADDRDNVYVSPTFGYELEWDEDVWEVENEETGERDFLFLIETDQTSLVYVEGYEAYDGDAVDCLDGSAAEILDQDDVDDVEPAEDEDGQEIAGEDDGVVFAAFTYTLELDDGDLQDRIGYFTCQTLVEDEAVLAFSFVGLAEEFEDDLPEWEDLLAGLSLPDAQPQEDDGEVEPDGDDANAGDDEDDADDGADDGTDDRDATDDDRDDVGAEGVSYRGGPARTGEQPGPAPAGEPQVIWSYDTGSRFVGAGAPAVADGLVFTNSSAVFAIDAETGDEVWTYESETNFGFVGPLVVAGGVLYAGGEDGLLYALEPESGAVIWQEDLGQGSPVNSAPILVDGVLYVTSWNGNAFAVDAESGDVLWDAPIGGVAISQPAYADGLLVLGDATTDVIALDAGTGEEVWRVATAEQVYSSPAIADGVVYVGSDDGLVYALDLDDGNEAWVFDTGGPVRSSPAVAAGVVYIGTEAGEVLALDAENGDAVWTFEADAAVNAAPVVAPAEDGDLLFVGDDAGTLYVIDIDEGELVETIAVSDAGLFWPAAVVDGVVYAGARDGVLYALAAA